jgi:hypothetical protein
MHGVNTQSFFFGSRMTVEKTDSVRSGLQTVKRWWLHDDHDLVPLRMRAMKSIGRKLGRSGAKGPRLQQQLPVDHFALIRHSSHY